MEPDMAYDGPEPTSGQNAIIVEARSGLTKGGLAQFRVFSSTIAMPRR